MGTVDRVLPWRRHHEAAAPDELTPLLASLPAAPPQGAGRHDQPGLRGRRRGPPQPAALQRRELHQPPAGRGPHRRRHRPRRDLRRRRAAPRRGRGHRDHPGRRRGRVRRRGRRRSSTGSPSSSASSSTPRRPSRPPRCARCWWRWPATCGCWSSSWPTGCTTCARSPRMPTRQAAAHRPGDARHLRPAGPPPRACRRCKQQLEDLSFAALHPKRFAELDHLVSSRTPEREVYLAEAVAEVRGRLAELSIDAEVTGRGKHLWSIYEKMVVRRAASSTRSSTSSRIRVIVDSVKDCYAALGCIHGALEAGGGAVQGLHRDAQVQPLPELAHHGDRARAASRSRCRSAPARCTSGPSGASPRTGRTRTASPSSDIDWLNRIIDWQAEVSDPAPVHGEPEDRPRAGRGLRVHAQGPGDHAAGRVDHRSTSPTPCTPRSATPASAPRSTAGSCRSTTSCVSGDTCEIFTSKVETRRAVAGLAEVRRVAAGAQQDPPVVQPRAARRRDRGRAATS